MSVDTELRELAVRSADRYTDALLAAHGWTRGELVDAIHGRLRTTYLEARRNGGLGLLADGTIGAVDDCPTPLKRRYRSSSAAARYQRRHPAPGAPLYPYECPTGGHWHLTHQTPEQQARIAERIAARAAPQMSTTNAPPPQDVS